MILDPVVRRRAEGLALTGGATGPVIRQLLAHIDQLEAAGLEQDRTRANRELAERLAWDMS